MVYGCLVIDKELLDFRVLGMCRADHGVLKGGLRSLRGDTLVFTLCRCFRLV